MDDTVTATPQQTQGALEATGAPTDIAVCGRGFFRIALGKGRYAYTRDGRMRINSGGELEFAGGYGTGIRAPAGSAGLVIARDGAVESMGADGSVQPIGRIALYDLAADGLRDAERGFYEAAEATLLPEDQVCLVQGCLEQSNVDVAKTLELLRLSREGDSADTENGQGPEGIAPETLPGRKGGA
jgi:flagellar basal-body rod protein FlgG